MENSYSFSFIRTLFMITFEAEISENFAHLILLRCETIRSILSVKPIVPRVGKLSCSPTSEQLEVSCSSLLALIYWNYTV